MVLRESKEVRNCKTEKRVDGPIKVYKTEDRMTKKEDELIWTTSSKYNLKS